MVYERTNDVTWRRFLLYAGLVAFAAVIILHFGQFSELVRLLRQARWYVLTFVLLAQAFSYYCNAKYYQSFLKIFNYRVPVKKLYQAALVINFVNQIFPSGGISGVSFLTRALHEEEVPTGKATLAQLARYIFTYLSFLVVLVIGFLLLFLGGNVSHVASRVTLLLILFIIIGSLLLIVIVGERHRVEKLAGFMVRAVNRLGRLWMGRRRKAITQDQQKRFFDEFYHGYHTVLAEHGHWWRPLFWALGGNLAEVGTVYVVYVAFAGHLTNPGIVIAAYTLANLLSLVSFFSSGLGIYEATMIATFVTLGVPSLLAISVTVVYRALNLLIFLPFGFYFYRQEIE